MQTKVAISSDQDIPTKSQLLLTLTLHRLLVRAAILLGQPFSQRRAAIVPEEGSHSVRAAIVPEEGRHSVRAAIVPEKGSHSVRAV